MTSVTPAHRLQSVPAHLQWLIADSLLLQAIANDRPIQRGAAGTRLNLLVTLFARFRLVYILLFLVGLNELTKLLRKQRHHSTDQSEHTLKTNSQQYPKFFFIGFGAGSEEKLYTSYCSNKNSAVARINQVKVESMGRWHQIGLLEAIASLFRSLITVRQAIAELPEEFRPWLKDFLTFAGMRLGYFSYLSAWFKRMKVSAPHVTEICFLAPDTPAFAAIDAGLRTLYLQHGLNRHSLILPKFDRVDALTHDEVNHFQKRLPNAAIRLVRQRLPEVSPQQPPCLLVASIYGSHHEMLRILPLLEHVSRLGVPIHVRPHPREDPLFWKSIDLPFEISLEEQDANFDEALERIKPTLVVSWFSTSLVDALYRGVIPVSVCSLDDPNIKDMVYPLFSHCLHWPSDQAEMTKVISDPDIYESTLSRLRYGM